MKFKTALSCLLCFFLLGSNLILANDDPCTATEITVNATCNLATFSNASATATFGVPAPGCAGYSGGDIWFSFTMPNYGYSTVIELSAGTMTDGGMAVYSGTDCTNLTLIACDDNSGTGNMPLLTIDDGCGFENAGATFWVRVWENGNDNNGTFDICAYTTPANLPSGVSACGGNLIAGNACCDALLLGDDMDGYCGNTGNYTDEPNELTNFCAFIDNNAWLAFVASETSVDISIASSNCTFGNGIQVAILETSDCTNFSVVSNCWNPGTEASGNLVATGLTVGETYYIMVDGWAGDICDYTLGIVSGVQTVSVDVSDTEICQGESTQLSVDVIGPGPYTYSWSPAASLDDPTSATPLATPGTSTDYTVTITGVNDNIHTASVTVYPNAPVQPVIIGPSSVCENTSGIVYTSSIANTSNYNWSVSGSAIVTGGNGADTILVDWGTAGGSVCLIAENNCGVSPQECIVVSATGQPNISVSDPPAACAPDPFELNTIAVTNTGSGSGLITYYDNLADAQAGMNDIFPPSVTVSGKYYVRMATGPDCYDIDSVNVVIEDPALVVVDPSDRCSPDFVDLDNVIINEVNGYPGGTKTYFTDSLDAVNNTSALTNTQVFTGAVYWVRYETPGGCTVVAPIDVDIDITPDITINQPAPLCPGGSIDLDTISYTEANGAMYTVTFFDNLTFATLDILPLTNTVVSMPQTYYLRAETVNNCVQIVEINIVAGIIPDAAMSGGGAVCQGSDSNILFTLNGSGPFDVVYTDGISNFTLNDISDGHSETVTITSDITYSLVSLTDANGCSGNMLGGDVVFTANPAPTAQISGDTMICGSEMVNLNFAFTGNGPFDAQYTDGTNTFFLNAVPANYTLATLVSANTTFSLVSVTDGGACPGTTSGSAAVNVVQPLVISNLSETCDASFTQYTVSFEISGGDPLSYVVTGGTGTLTGNTFTSAVINSGDNYSFTVSDASSACPGQLVSGVFDCVCTTDAGSMDTTPITVCEDETGVASFISGSSTINPGDIFQYILHDNPADVPGTIFARSDNPEFGIQPGMNTGTTYYISPIAGMDDGTANVDLNHLCFDMAPGVPITFYELPSASVTGDASICSGNSADLIFTFPAGTGPFDVVLLDLNTNTNINVTNINDGETYSLSPDITTSYSIISVTDNAPATCTGTGSGTVTITVNEAPSVSNIQFVCNDINTQYQVVFEIVGGDPASYQVTGGLGNLDNLTNTFTSSFIDSGTSYNFQVDDGNGCGPEIISGSYVCDCTSNAGEMQNTLLEVCENDMASAQHIATNLNFDANDVLGFILYDQSGTLPGSVLFTNSTPDFAYDPSLTFGTVYHIAAVVGDDDGNGFPVLDNSIDPCLSISSAQPVVFSQNPIASILGNTTICQGDSTDIMFNISGTGPFNLEYTDGTDNYTLNNVMNGDAIRVSPNNTTTYSLVSISLGTAPLCMGTIDLTAASITVDVIEIPAVSDIMVNCNQAGTDYTVSFEITGGNAALYSVNGDPGTLNGNIFTSDPLPGGSTYSFEISDGSTCPPVIITNIEYCNCTPDIQPLISLEGEISCFAAADGILAVTNQNGIAPFSFQWSSGAVGNRAEALATGWHYVTMTDGNNCVSVDSLFLDEPVSISAEINHTNLLCYGADDATITIENITGGAGGYTYSLDYNTSFIENTFYDLPAGAYVATIIDREGCTYTETIEITEPAEILLDLGEDMLLELGDSVEIMPIVSQAIDTFIWSSSLMLECPDCWEQIAKPLETMAYNLTVMTNDGCTVSERIVLTVMKERPIFIPNVFSPNGDGVNDIFKIYTGGGAEMIRQFKVFDRWGALVYEIENLPAGREDFGWNGKLKGRDAVQGVYVYFLEILYKDGSSEVIRGDVSLLR